MNSKICTYSTFFSSNLQKIFFFFSFQIWIFSLNLWPSFAVRSVLLSFYKYQMKESWKEVLLITRKQPRLTTLFFSITRRREKIQFWTKTSFSCFEHENFADFFLPQILDWE